MTSAYKKVTKVMMLISKTVMRALGESRPLREHVCMRTMN